MDGVGGWVWHVITKCPHLNRCTVRPFFCIAQATPALLWNSVLSIPRQQVDAIVFCYVGMNRK